MDYLRQYLLSIFAASIICSIIIKLTKRQQVMSGIIKVIAAVFLSVTIFSPLLDLNLDSHFSLPDRLSINAEEIISAAQTDIKNQTEEIIIDQTKSYILEKAALYGADLDVSIKLNSDTRMPASVTLYGVVAPVTKQRIQQLLVEELGIPEGDQIWITSRK